MSVKSRICKLEKKVGKKSEVPLSERIQLFYDDGTGAVGKEMEAEKIRLVKKYGCNVSDLTFIISAIPEPKPRPVTV